MENHECPCRVCRNVHTVAYGPDRSEAVVQCEHCGRLWYTLLFERMDFSGGLDTMEEYFIPITAEELRKILETPSRHPDLAFLKGRTARVVHESGTAEITSDFALRRCGR